MLKPSADRVIIKPDTPEERKVGSIILPANMWHENNSGTVIAVGPGPTGEHGTCPMTSIVGDRVWYPPSLGRKVEIEEDGKATEYHIIRQHEVLVTIGQDKKAK